MVAAQPSSGDARTFIDLALVELSRGELSSAPAWLRRAKLLADAARDTDVSTLARFCLALEEGIRGDFAGAERYVRDAEMLGTDLPSTLENASAVRCIIDGYRVASLLSRGDRALAMEAWNDANSAAQLRAHAGPVDLRFHEMATRGLRACDPRSAWLVGPKAVWIEAPDGSRVDLSNVALLRKIFRHLMTAHLQAPSRFVTSRELCAAVWPDMDPTSLVVRNRMKVALFKMRAAGLRSAIERTTEGLRLAPEHRFSWCQPASQPASQPTSQATG